MVGTYTNLLVVDRKTGKHPMMIGHLFMHQKKTYDAYNYFFSKLVSFNREVANVLVFGTDGEEPLSRQWGATCIMLFILDALVTSGTTVKRSCALYLWQCKKSSLMTCLDAT